MKKFFLKSKRFWFAIAPMAVRLGVNFLAKKGFLGVSDIPDSISDVTYALQAIGVFYVVKGGPQLTVKPTPTPSDAT